MGKTIRIIELASPYVLAGALCLAVSKSVGAQWVSITLAAVIGVCVGVLSAKLKDVHSRIERLERLYYFEDR